MGGDGNDGSSKSGRLTAISVGTIGLTPVTNYGVSTKIAHTGFLNRIIRLKIAVAQGLDRFSATISESQFQNIREFCSIITNPMYY